MLKDLIRYYFIIAALLFVIFAFAVTEDSSPIFFYHFTVLVFYGLLMYYYSTITKSSIFSTFNLLLIVGLFSGLIIFTNNLISYIYSGNFFVFSEGDASTYDYYGALANKSEASFKYVFSKWPYEDWGAIYLVSLMYKIEQSNLILNIFYWILGLFTATYLFRLASRFMSLKYAFLCSLAFSLSSYFQWFNSSGLKESMMVFLIIFAYHNYYKFYINKKFIFLIYFAISVFLLVFFRPVISVFIVLSIASGVIFGQKMSASKIAFIAIIIIIFIAGSAFLIEQRDKYITFNNTDELIAMKESEGMIKGTPTFTFMVNAIASLLGPFTTVNPDVKIILSFYTSGLIFKSLFSFAFFYGIFLVIKSRYKDMYPIIIFPLLEIISLVMLFEALELRKSLPHFPFIYIIAFYALNQIINYSKLRKKRINTINAVFVFMIFILTVYWNFRT